MPCLPRSIPAMQSRARRAPAGTCSSADRLSQMLQVGERAPEFKLPTTSGRELTLADALDKHKALVFLFYVLDFTGGGGTRRPGSGSRQRAAAADATGIYATTFVRVSRTRRSPK